MKQKLFEMGQVTVQVTSPSFLWNLKNEGGAKKHSYFDIIWKIGQNQGFWAITASLFSEK